MPTQKLFLDNTGLTELLNKLGQYLKGKLDKLTFDTTPTINSTNPVTSGGVKAALDVKADKTELPLVVHMDDTILTCDTSIAEIYTAYSTGRVVQMKVADLSTPLSLVSSDSSSAAFAVTDKGTSLIISGTNENGSDVWTIDSFVAQDRLTFDSAPTTGSQNPVTSNGIKTALNGKQNTLVSGTNIKTVNGNTLLGSGNITIDSGVQYVEYADYEEMQADMSQESGTIGCDTNLYKYYIFNGQNETWDAVTKVTDLRWIKTANGGTDTYERLLSDISNDSDLYVVNRAPASVEASNGTITVRYTDMFYIYIFEIDSTGQSNEMSAPIVTSVKNINGNQLSGSGNIVLDGSTLDYTGQGRYHLHASETIDQSLDNLDTAIHDLDNIVGEEILTPTIVEHSYIVRDPAASRGNLATSYPWRVEVFKGLSEGENLLVTYSGTNTSSSAQVAGWYTDGDNLINANYSYISNLNGYAQNIVGKTYLITVPDSTVKALALSLHTNIQAEVKRIGKIQAEIHGIENPNGIESITTTESAASGGNNTVTITETNGTTTTFNVKNGVDGVSLGEIALVQTTGDSEESVMSQKAVTEYGRKVTAEDLNGTSEWIRAKLTEEGWAFGKYIKTNGDLGDNANYCASFFIPMGGFKGHTITIGFMFNNWGTGCIAWYDGNKDFITNLYYTTNVNNQRVISIGTSEAWDSVEYARITLNPNRLNECYIIDNTTGEFIFNGASYLENKNKENLIDYNTFTNIQRSVITFADLNGSSTWVRQKLSEAGWFIEVYLNANGVIGGSDEEMCVSPFIELDVSLGHTYIFQLQKDTSTQNTYIVFFDENDAKISSTYTGVTGATISVTPTNTSIVKFRFSCNLNKFPNVYIIDSTTGDYLFKGDNYLRNICKEKTADLDYIGNALITQELGDSTIKVPSQKVITEVQENVDAIGRRVFGTTSVFNAKDKTEMCWSKKRYNISSKPWVDVVCYNALPGAAQRSCWFGFTPYISSSKPSTLPDYIGFVDNVWSMDFIVRRNGTTVHTTTKALDNFCSSAVAFGCRFDFRRKTVQIAWRHVNGAYNTSTIDLSAYDLDLGLCYMCTTIGYCSYPADLYVGWNNKTNMSDFSAFFSSPLTVGQFKKFAEYTYPSDDIDGSVVKQFTNLMKNWSATQNENGHWVTSIDVSSFTAMTHDQPSISPSHYLYDNWDLQIWIGKIKATDGSLQFKQRYTTIKDVYDLTDNVFLTAVDDVYTITSGHTVEVRMVGNINGRGQMMSYLGTCTVEMWDWEVHVAMNTNITPENYDGKKIFGGMEFLFDFPNLIVDLPLMGSSNYYAQGFMKYTNNKLYARIYDTSTNTYVDKQISNT